MCFIDINICWGRPCWACDYICYISINVVLNALVCLVENIPHIFFKYANHLIYVLEHYQYASKHIDVLMFGTTVDEYILNPSMNVMVVCPQLYLVFECLYEPIGFERTPYTSSQHVTKFVVLHYNQDIIDCFDMSEDCKECIYEPRLLSKNKPLHIIPTCHQVCIVTLRRVDELVFKLSDSFCSNRPITMLTSSTVSIYFWSMSEVCNESLYEPRFAFD
jgi:hypothetical protein